MDHEEGSGSRSRMTSGNVVLKTRRGILRGGQCRDSDPDAAQVHMRRNLKCSPTEATGMAQSPPQDHLPESERHHNSDHIGRSLAPRFMLAQGLVCLGC